MIEKKIVHNRIFLISVILACGLISSVNVFSSPEALAPDSSFDLGDASVASSENAYQKILITALQDPQLTKLAQDSRLGAVVSSSELINVLQSVEGNGSRIILELARQIYEIDHRTLNHSSSAQTWARKFSTDTLYLLLDPGGQAAGFMDAGLWPTKEGATIHALATKRGGQVKGRGTLLMDAYLRRMRQLGIAVVYLECGEDVIGFYKTYLDRRGIFCDIGQEDPDGLYPVSIELNTSFSEKAL